MYRELTQEIRAWRDWEVLDEGVGSSLKTHLQEVLPSCKGEQSLTFKRHQRSTVARWEGCQVHTLKIRPKPLADSSSITPMSEINRKVWTWNTKDSLLSLDYFTLKLDYRKPWPIAIFISENSSLLSKKYDFLLGKATFGPGHAGLFSALLVGRLVVVARGLYLARHLFTLFS